jgi:hypothetical protein
VENQNNVKKGMVWHKPFVTINGSVKIESVLKIDSWPILFEFSNYLVVFEVMKDKGANTVFNGQQ